MKIISGGQTGVDRAALDAALESGFPCGGFVPKGRLAEDGVLAPRYPVQECDSQDYALRTELNVVHSDATLILNRGPVSGGTWATRALCQRHGRPYRVVSLAGGSDKAVAEAVGFIRSVRPKVLNVAGPRESKVPGIYAQSLAVLRRVLASFRS